MDPWSARFIIMPGLTLKCFGRARDVGSMKYKGTILSKCAFVQSLAHVDKGVRC